MSPSATPSGSDLLGIIEMIHREKQIDKEVLFEGLESALLTAARRKYGNSETLEVHIDRETGTMTCHDEGEEIEALDLGRIAAQTAKQVFMQKIREAESDILYNEYAHQIDMLVFGTVKRFEAGALIVDLGKTEAFLPRSEQVRSEHYHPGDRIRAYVTNVEKVGPKLRIVLSRAHPNLVFRLFELEIPEVAEGVVEISHLVREPGYRTKMLVRSHDVKVDPIGACLGVRGSRINSIRDEIGGEKVDIIPYTENLVELVVQALKPADVLHVEIAEDYSRAVVNVDEEHLSLAIGRKGLNVRLAARLCGMAINIVNPAQEAREAAEAAAKAAAEAAETEGVEGATTEEAAAEAVATDADQPDAATDAAADADQPEAATDDTVEAVADPDEKIEDFVVKSPVPEVETPAEPPVEEEAVAEESVPPADAESTPQADAETGPPKADAGPRREA